MKSMNPFLFLLGALSLIPLIGFAQNISAPSADHHIHIRSEAGTDALVRILEKVRNQTGVQIEPSTGAADVIALLDSAGTSKAALLSTAYFYEMPEVEFEDARAKTRRENEYVAREAAKYPGRLAAFCGVNPLAEYAMNEIEQCGEDERVTGLKLHFANSDVDLRDEEQVQKMARVFSAANSMGLAVIVHLWTRDPDYGRKDARIFLNRILPEALDVPVQIAHLGGPSGFGAPADSASAVFAEAVEDGNPLMDNVWFDLAAVPADPKRAKGEKQLEMIRESNKKLARRIRELGPDRILWATDWIAGPAPVYTAKLRSFFQALPEDLVKTISENVAPYLR